MHRAGLTADPPAEKPFSQMNTVEKTAYRKKYGDAAFIEAVRG